MGHFQEGTIHDQVEKQLCEIFKCDHLAAFLFIGDGVGECVKEKNRCYWFRIPPSSPVVDYDGPQMARVDSFGNLHVYSLEQRLTRYADFGEVEVRHRLPRRQGA